MVESIKELKKICRPVNIKTNFLSVKFYRPISIYFTKLFIILGVTANQITISTIIIGIFGSALFFTGNLYIMFAGVLVLIFNFILDDSDGEVARYNKAESLLGIHIEQIPHHLLPRLYFFGIAFSVFLNTNKLSVLIFGLLCTVFSVSVVMDSLCWELVNQKLHQRFYKKKEWKFKSSKKVDNIGETKYKLVEMLNFPFRCPYDKIVLSFFILIEIINKKVMLFKPFMLLYFVIIFYGIAFTLMQISSFIVHYKSRSIESYYQTLFGKNK